jgi:hypothetical protein
MGRQFGRLWAATAGGFILTYGGMSCLRVLGLGLFDPDDGGAFTLLVDAVFWAFGGLLAGLVNAALTVSWVEAAVSRRYRSSSLAVGLTSGLLGTYAVDLMGWLAGIAAVVGFIVLVQIVDAIPSRVLRGAVAILLVVSVQMFFRSQVYKILRARQTVYFVETNLARMKTRGAPLPRSMDELEKRLGRYAKLHGIRSVRTDPWSYDYFYPGAAAPHFPPGRRRAAGSEPRDRSGHAGRRHRLARRGRGQARADLALSDPDHAVGPAHPEGLRARRSDSLT